MTQSNETKTSRDSSGEKTLLKAESSFVVWQQDKILLPFGNFPIRSTSKLLFPTRVNGGSLGILNLAKSTIWRGRNKTGGSILTVVTNSYGTRQERKPNGHELIESRILSLDEHESPWALQAPELDFALVLS